MNNKNDNQEIMQLLEIKFFIKRFVLDYGNIYAKGLLELCEQYIEILVNIKKNNEENET